MSQGLVEWKAVLSGPIASGVSVLLLRSQHRWEVVKRNEIPGVRDFHHPVLFSIGIPRILVPH